MVIKSRRLSKMSVNKKVGAILEEQPQFWSEYDWE